MTEHREVLPEELARRAAAAGSMDALKASRAFDELMAQIDSGRLELDGKDGFIQQLIKASLERGLQAELSGHLGYDKGDPVGRFLPNSRNGSYPKTLGTSAGDVDLAVPRDRDGSFTPHLVPKGARRTAGLDDMIISLYAGGMTVRDIAHHLESTLGTELSQETISKITDEVLDEVLEWQKRPLDPIYPILYLDAIVIKVRDGHQVQNRAAHIAVGVDMEGIKHVLGIWVEASEGAKFWAGVCAELANRGIRDVLIVCCDGLTGFPEAIAATWPAATVQTCVVHLIRASMRFIGYQDRKKVAAALRPIYTAPTAEAAQNELDAFEGSDLGRKYPATVRTWRNGWEKFTPFLAFPPPVRRIIYTTNAIESLNARFRRAVRHRGHFPNEQSALKVLYLVATQRRQNRENLSGKITGWKHILNALTVHYGDRMANNNR
jgi:putative transposase